MSGAARRAETPNEMAARLLRGGGTPLAASTVAPRAEPTETPNEMAARLLRGSTAPIAAAPDEPAAPADNRGIVQSGIDAIQRGASNIIPSIVAGFDTDKGLAMAEEANKANPRRTPNFEDAKGFGESVASVAETAAESLPLVAGSVVGAVAGTLAAPVVGAGAVLGGALGAAAATAPATFGGIKMEQKRETGGTNNLTAAVGTLFVSTLDSVLPGKVARSLLGPAREAVERSVTAAILRGGGKGVLAEAPTEAAQTVIEKIAANPENARILVDPKTPEERAKRTSLLYQIGEAAAVGGVVGGPLGAVAGVAGRKRQGEPETADEMAARLVREPYTPQAKGRGSVDDYMSRIQLLESNTRDPDTAKNPLSSATGRFQFTDETWLAYMRREAPELTKGRSNDAVLGMRSNRRLQEQMMRAYTGDSAKALEAAGLPIANGTLGVLHRFGQGGGVAVLRAAKRNRDTPISKVVSAAVLAANPDLKTAKMDTAGEVVDFYEQRLGLGLTFNRNGLNETRLGGDDVRTRDARAGVDFTSLSLMEGANAASDLFDAALERVLNSDGDARYAKAAAEAKAQGKPAPSAPDLATRDRIPEATRERLALALETPPADTAIPQDSRRVLARIMELADGVATINVDTVQASQIQQAASEVLDQLGYAKERTPGDTSAALDPANFRRPKDTAASGDPTTPRWKIANSLRLAFSLLNDNENLGRITSESGGRVIASSLRALGAAQAAQSERGGIAAKNATGAKRRTTAKAAAKAARMQALFDRGADAIEFLSETPKNQKQMGTFENPAEARAAVLNMFDGTNTIPASRAIGRLFTEFTPMMTRERSSERGKGYYTFFKQIEALAERAGATDPATREYIRTMFKTSDRRAAALRDQLKGESTLRAETREAERAERNERRARDIEAWHKSIANVRDSQILNSVDRLAQSVPMLMDVLEGNTAKAEAYAPNLRDPGFIFKIFKGTGTLNAGLNVLPLTAIDKNVGRKIFGSFTLNGRRQSFVQHILRVGTAATGFVRAHIADAERVSTILTDSVAKEKEPKEEMRRLTAIMLDATHARLAAADETDARKYQSLSVYFEAMADGSYDETMRAKDPNGRHAREDADGNWRYSDSTDAKIRALSEALDARPDAQRDAYVQVRGLIKDSASTLLLSVINNRRRELGLPVVQKTTDAEKIVEAAAQMFEGDPQLSDGTRESMTELVRGSLEGDYFPLERSGKYSLFARQTIPLSGATKAGVEARAVEMQKSSPFIQFEDRGRVPTAVQNIETGQWELKLERVFYSQFDTKKDAEKARMALVNPTTPADATPDEVRTARELDPSFSPDEIGPVYETDSGVERQRSRALSDAQAAALLGAAKDDVALKNILLDLLPDRRMAASLRSRKDVLGAPPLMSEILRSREPKVAAALGRVSTAQDMREVFAKAREHQQRTTQQTLAATTDAERERLAGRADRQRMLTDYLEKRATEKIDVFSLLSNVNDFLARAATVWFLAGVSQSAMNLLQVHQYGVPEFGARYGVGAGVRLATTALRAQRIAGGAFWRGRVRKGNTNEAVGYLTDGREIDARRFYTTDPETGESRINTAAEMAALSWDDIAGRPLTGNPSFAVDAAGAPRVFLLSEAEFEHYQKGKYTASQVIAISNARKGGHLSAVFVEEPRVVQLRERNMAGDALDKFAAMRAKMFDVATFLPSTIEYGNRLAVVLATLEEEARRYKEKGVDVSGELPPGLYQEVERNASDLNDNINANYNTLNRSVLQRRMGALMAFTTLPTNIMMHLWHVTTSIVSPTTAEGGYSSKQAAALAAGLFVTIGLTAGGRGAIPVFLDWFARGGLNVAAMLMGMFDDDEDDDGILSRTREFGAKTAIEMAIREQSDFFGDLWTKGALSMATGADLQSRMGVDQFPMRIDTGVRDGKDSLGRVMLTFLGPLATPAGAALDVFAGYKAGAGMNWRAMESLLPKFVRDAGRAVNFNAGEGLKDSKGNTIMSPEQTSANFATFVQLMGFTPNNIAELNRARFVELERDMKLRARRAAIMDDMTNMDDTMDFDALIAFNVANPERAITGKAIVSAIKRKQGDEVMRESVTSGLSPTNPLESMELAELMGLGEPVDASAWDMPEMNNSSALDTSMFSEDEP